MLNGPLQVKMQSTFSNIFETSKNNKNTMVQNIDKNLWFMMMIYGKFFYFWYLL